MKLTAAAAIVLIICSCLFFLIWGLLFGDNVYGNCQIAEYAEAPGSSCPWPNECVDAHCVLVGVYWASLEQIRHFAWLDTLGYPGCWTTDSLDKIRSYLAANYPVNANKSCFSDGSNGALHFTDPNQTLIASSLFYGGVATGAFGVALLLVWLVAYLLSRKRQTQRYQALVVNNGKSPEDY